MPTPDDEINQPTDLSETADRIFGFLARQRLVLMLTTCSMALIAIAVILYLPDRYSSEATLVAMQQQVSQRYVDPSNNMTVADAIQAMTQQVLSRAQLLGIINDLGLYKDVRNRATPEGLVKLMRKDLTIEPLEESRGAFGAFKIAFAADNPQRAQAVTSRLTSLFIEWHLKRRGNQATTTTNFLTEQLAAAQQRLKEQDDKRAAFKTQYLGELPEQQAANFEMLSELRAQLQGTTANLLHVQQQRSSLQSLIGENVARLQSEKTRLLTKFTPRHPDVIQKDQEIEKVTALLNRLRVPNPGLIQSSSPIASDNPLGPIQGQVEANELESENLLKEERRIKSEMSRYQNRLNLSPIREQQLAGILRDYELYTQTVRDLQNKLLQAEQTSSLEERQEGQQFKLVDPPTLPIAPVSPKRLILSFAGIAVGLVAGLVLAFLLDSRDHSFHSEKALNNFFALPLVLSLPVLLTPREEKSRKWKRLFEYATGCVMLLAIFVAEVYVYRRG